MARRRRPRRRYYEDSWDEPQEMGEFRKQCNSFGMAILITFAVLATILVVCGGGGLLFLNSYSEVHRRGVEQTKQNMEAEQKQKWDEEHKP